MVEPLSGSCGTASGFMLPLLSPNHLVPFEDTDQNHLAEGILLKFLPHRIVVELGGTTDSLQNGSVQE